MVQIFGLKEKQKTYYLKALHPGSPNGTFTKEMDIMDVWFDSGSSHRGVLENRPELSFPADHILKVVTNIVVGLTLQLQLL